MKKTLDVNIGSMAFTLDENAYLTLRDYLDDVESRLAPDERAEVLEDVESRVADILDEALGVSRRVVTLEMVQGAIAVIGRADCFGEKRTAAPPPYGHERRRQEEGPRRLYRSRRHRVIGGVCAGVADYLNMDTTVVRVATALLVLLGGLSLWAYIIMWIIIPDEPMEYYYRDYGRNGQQR